MGKTHKTAHASLGMSLVKKKKPVWDRSTNAEHGPVNENNTNALKSVTEENSYDEFIATAALANKEFTAEKLNVKFVAMSTTTAGADDQAEDGKGEDAFNEEELRMVTVPRRPKWTKEMTAEELDTAEKEAFLDWRRGMAHLQNRQGITPFERNLEVWRQLWRVVERSDVVVQIVDARNPLLYRCEDLESYVKEMGKQNVLLINKADFLSQSQRKMWSDYFTSVDLPHAFYSAVAASASLKEEDSDDENNTKGQHYEDAGEEASDEETHESENEDTEEEDVRGNVVDDDGGPEVADTCKIFTRNELIDYLRKFKKEKDEETLEVYAVGLVGYPNVGKSSTINSLMTMKKTSVSATPGKTKHFQTLFLDDDILLCDCPGLVMPSFGGSKGEMVLGGILPIDQLTSYDSAAELLVQRISMTVLEGKYGVTLPQTYAYLDFLNSYAAIRGFMTVRGIPDTSRAARKVLKDYVTGRLCYCHSPPTVSREEFDPAMPSTEATGRSRRVREFESRPVGQKVRLENTLDRQFFTPSASAAHVKGKVIIPNNNGLASSHPASSSSSIAQSGSGEGKPWKRHGNRNKKEKLRRVYRHLDVE